MVDQNIEELVQNRKIRAAKSAIKRYLADSFSAERVILASQWLRRLSLYREGLNLLLISKERFQRFELSSQQTLNLITSEFFSAVGAARYALGMASDLQPKTLNDYEVLAGIYFSNYHFEEAYRYFAKAYELYSVKSERGALLCRLSMADCLSKLGGIDEAVAIAEQTIRETSGPLSAIAWQAYGQYLAQKNLIEKSLGALMKAKKLFPRDDVTFDYALLCRWSGYVYGRKGARAKARYYFAQSTKLILNAKLSDEVWLENYFLMKEAGVISPAEARLLDNYPEAINRQGESRLEKAVFIGRRNSEIEISLEANEYRVGAKRYLGVPAEVKLLAFLRLAGTWGIEFERAKFIMWPGEINSYIHLEQRMFLFIQRLRQTYKVRVYVKKRRIFILPDDLHKVSVDRRRLGLSFFFNRSQFTAKDLGTFYSMAKSTRTNYLREWCNTKLIKSVKRGPQTYYRVIQPPPAPD